MDAGSSSLSPKASQETFISLLQLEPEPIETPPATDKDLPPLPEDAAEDQRAPTVKATSTASLGLSGSGHGAVYYLSRIQKYSTYSLSIFTTIHLANTSLIPLFTRSVPASESYLLLAREIYQTSLTEPLLVGLPIIAHVASGVALRLIRRSQNLRRYGGATPGVLPLHHSKTHASHAGSSGTSSPRSGLRIWPHLSYISASGYGLALFLGAHIFMNRGLPLAVEGDSANIGLAYVSHGFARHSAVSWLAYTGLLSLSCGHMIWGWAKWLGLAQRAGWKVDLKSGHATGNSAVDKKIRKRRRRMWLGIHGAATAATVVWAAGGLGVVARGGLMQGWLGDVYDGLYSTVGL
ncbi:putative -dimethylguanosine trna methyltransferase protein [Phaeoacremonium minimum UCRPA7]|uniref:Putative-dimethylguanosine trna methyltransferase protein n=1 Tax=Phaeoacremonium minimum (strain UCR-PA7) TaxID=1286976 RepID=R8B911_PHAM7|nr:putative -dimethylguanosine trna methyltransferase protein [Phaeoacremonium minimum UCRPA7]EON95773.1 putative -dimethylguanosine trna methyltransferase protein [Phaeoacremonium minimum UCRPA7]